MQTGTGENGENRGFPRQGDELAAVLRVTMANPGVVALYRFFRTAPAPSTVGFEGSAALTKGIHPR